MAKLKRKEQVDIRFKFIVSGGNRRMIQRDIAMYFKKEPDVMTVQQVAKLFHCSKNTLYAMIKEGRLGCVRIGRKFLIPKSVIIEFIYNEKYYEVLSPKIPKNLWTSDSSCGIVGVADGRTKPCVQDGNEAKDHTDEPRRASGQTESRTLYRGLL